MTNNATIVTIPKEIHENVQLIESDSLKIGAKYTTKKEQERDIELKKIQLEYPNIAKGTLTHKGEVIAILDEVRFRIDESYVGTSGFDCNLDNLPLVKRFDGFILDGKFTPEASTEKHYGGQNLNDDWFKKNLTTTEIMKLKCVDGMEIILEDIHFYDDVIYDNKLCFISGVEFNSHNFIPNPKKIA